MAQPCSCAQGLVPRRESSRCLIGVELIYLVGNRWSRQDPLHIGYLPYISQVWSSPGYGVRSIPPQTSSPFTSSTIYPQHYLRPPLRRSISRVLSHVSKLPTPSYRCDPLLIPWDPIAVPPFYQPQSKSETVPSRNVHGQRVRYRSHWNIPCSTEHQDTTVTERLRGPAGIDRWILRLPDNC